ncbi:hypothetical protein [Devosia pacifica]|nr:hypothetical protein [Devosia pacifica]
MARHGNSPVDAVEDWDIDKLIDYSRALGGQLSRENRGRGGKRR